MIVVTFEARCLLLRCKCKLNQIRPTRFFASCRYLAELRELNFGHNISEHARSASRGADSVPASSLWEREMILERWLSSVDGKAASVLLFRGTASLHALYDFLQVTRWNFLH